MLPGQMSHVNIFFRFMVEFMSDCIRHHVIDPACQQNVVKADDGFVMVLSGFSWSLQEPLVKLESVLIAVTIHTDLVAHHLHLS